MPETRPRPATRTVPVPADHRAPARAAAEVAPRAGDGVRGPDRLVLRRGPRSGQTIVVSLDSTRLGPALGGLRLQAYPTWQDGVADAARLSAAMTVKAALAGLDHGGGKAVVALGTGSAADWTGRRRAELLTDVADVVETLGGSYVTGPDIGTGPADMDFLHHLTPHVLCRPETSGGSGNSSRPTATGVLAALDAVCAHRFPGRDPATLSFSVLGLGHVGTLVAGELAARGTRLLVTDVDERRREAAAAWGARWTDPEEALRAEVDVVVPCAVGGLLTPTSVAQVRCRAVVGPANNQLDHGTTADLLAARGITWVPDQLVSAGGIVSAVARERLGASVDDADAQVRRIGDRVTHVLQAAEAHGTTPWAVVLDLVRQRLTDTVPQP